MSPKGEHKPVRKTETISCNTQQHQEKVKHFTVYQCSPELTIIISHIQILSTGLELAVNFGVFCKVFSQIVSCNMIVPLPSLSHMFF